MQNFQENPDLVSEFENESKLGYKRQNTYEILVVLTKFNSY
jgi:hypothetical protein